MKVVLDLQGCQSPDGSVRGIGRYVWSLACAMAKHCEGHELWIALNATLAASAADLRRKLAGVVMPERIVSWESLPHTAEAHAGNRRRTRIAEQLREDFLQSCQADVVFSISMFEGFVDDAVTSVPRCSRALQVAVLFDLIPWVMPEVYLNDGARAQWYERKMEQLRRCDLLLSISEYTRKQGIELLGCDPKKIVNIAAGLPEPFTCGASTKPNVLPAELKHVEAEFILYVGGFDPRKNLERLLEAYARLSHELRNKHRLVFAGPIDRSIEQRLKRQLRALGVPASCLHILGRVDDETLVALYRACHAFVLPSLQEGFGLTVLEAMAFGVPTIAARSSSLPEVVGREEALFDPTDVADISATLSRVITDNDYREWLRKTGLEQAAKFTWEDTARRTWSAIEAVCNDRARCHRGEEEVDHDGSPPVTWLSVAPPSADAVIAALGYRPQRLRAYGLAEEILPTTWPSLWTYQSLNDLPNEDLWQAWLHVSDEAPVLQLMDRLRHCPVRLHLHGGTLERVFDAMRDRQSDLASITYRWGGYSALPPQETDVAEVANRLPAQSIVYLDDAWELGRSDAIDLFWKRVREWTNDSVVAQLSERERGQLWGAIASNFPRLPLQPTWYVDISYLVVASAVTGIQRVVRHVLEGLLRDPPQGYRIEPVYASDDGVYRYARSFCQREYYPHLTLPADAPVAFAAHDVFLGLDLAAHLVPSMRHAFTHMRAKGVRLIFVLYDVIPLHHPEWFPGDTLPLLTQWYHAVSEIADGVIAISQTVANEYALWLGSIRSDLAQIPHIGWFPLGADLLRQKASALTPKQLIAADGSTTFLMVGTIEPRKGYRQVLEAFELLWASRQPVKLVIIGRPGWGMTDFCRRLQRHTQTNMRLFWHASADDELLTMHYQNASALIAASQAEGFGLPLVEAAQHGCAIIARDLPVFREVAGNGAYYFSGDRPQALADAVIAWRAMAKEGHAPHSQAIQWLTWEQSAARLKEVVLSHISQIGHVSSDG